MVVLILSSPFFINHSVLPVWCTHTLPCEYRTVKSEKKKKKSHNLRVKIFIWPNQKYTFAPLFDRRRRCRSLLFNVRIHAHGHCKGHQFMYASNVRLCVCIKNCLSFLRLILHYLLFWCKNGKKTIQLALAMAKSILHVVNERVEKKKNTRFTFLYRRSIPFAMQTHTDAIVRSVGFWSSTLCRGINNKRRK